MAVSLAETASQGRWQRTGIWPPFGKVSAAHDNVAWVVQSCYIR